MNEKIPVLNSGYVELIAEGQTPNVISQIAGISHRNGLPDIKDLIKWGHLSPLEFSYWIFKVKAPIFVFRQWFRHRTGNYMEESLRYNDALPDFYIPNSSKEIKETLTKAFIQDFETYKTLISLGLPKETARIKLPLAIYSTAYIGFDMRNLINFLSLRLTKHAQKEIREYAKVIYNLIPKEFQYAIQEDIG